MFLAPLPLGWLEEIGPLLLVVFWVIRQILSAVGGKEEEEAEPQKRKKPLTAEQEEQRKSVEEFLKEIGVTPVEETTQIEVQPVESIATTQEAPVDTSEDLYHAEVAPGIAKISRKPIDPFEEPPQQRPEDSPRKNPKPRRSKQPKIESRVEPYASLAAPQKLSERDSHLGERIAQADAKVEARLHNRFDHQVGNLSHQEVSGDKQPSQSNAAGKTSTQAARILELLSSPSGMRDAILLNEILTPVSDRLDK